MQLVTGDSNPIWKPGKSVYRCLVPIEELMTDPITRPLFDGEPSGFASTVNQKTQMFFVSYPCRADKVLNVAVFHDTKPHQADAEDWNSPARIEDVLEVLEGCHPVWAGIIRHAERVNCFTLGARDAASRMNSGNVVMVGDAAHHMQPTHAGGMSPPSLSSARPHSHTLEWN